MSLRMSQVIASLVSKVVASVCSACTKQQRQQQQKYLHHLRKSLHQALSYHVPRLRSRKNDTNRKCRLLLSANGPCGLDCPVQCTRSWMKRYRALAVVIASACLILWALHSCTGNGKGKQVDHKANFINMAEDAKEKEAFYVKPPGNAKDEDINFAHGEPVPMKLSQNVQNKDAVLKASSKVKMMYNVPVKKSPNVERNNTAPVKLASNGRKQETGTFSAKVLLLAYFRTGSTFTAEILHQTKGTFYTFEPLHALYSYYRRKSLAPALLNGTQWYRILEGYQMPYAQHVLDSLLHCRISHIDKISLLAYSKKSAVLSKFRPCIEKFKTSPQDINDVCVRQLQEDCLRAPIRVIKTIRTPMRLVSGLLEADPSLKVIHLLRDPRGHTRSWMRHDGQRGKPADFIEAICNRVRDDLETRYELEKQYPGTFLEIIYEDLAQHPMAVLKKVYSWLKVPIQQKVINWLVNSTHCHKDGNFVETFRKNSTETAYSWMKNVTFSHVKLVNRYCGDIVEYGRFPPLKTEQAMKEFRVPLRQLLP